MEPLRVVEIHVVLNPEAQLRQTAILLDLDIFVLQRPPEAFHSDIVPAVSASIRADLNHLPFQFGNELFAGELAALIRIEDLRSAVTRYRRPQRFNAMNRIMVLTTLYAISLRLNQSTMPITNARRPSTAV